MTLKIHSLANFTTLKYLLTDAKCNSTPWKDNSHQPRAERTQAGERHPGGDVHPERTPSRRGQKPIPFCFLLLLLQSAIHADGLPRVSARFAHLALGWWLLPFQGGRLRSTLTVNRSPFPVNPLTFFYAKLLGGSCLLPVRRARPLFFAFARASKTS